MRLIPTTWRRNALRHNNVTASHTYGMSEYTRVTNDRQHLMVIAMPLQRSAKIDDFSVTCDSVKCVIVCSKDRTCVLQRTSTGRMSYSRQQHCRVFLQQRLLQL